MTRVSQPQTITSHLELRAIKKHFDVQVGFRKRQRLQVLNQVSLSVQKKQTLGVVGESGCGKSTLAKVIMQIYKADGGDVFLEGQPLQDIPKADYRRKVQMIFQDPYRSLNPRKKAASIVAEPLRINSDHSKNECRDRAVAIMEKVGLRADYADRYPHMFSGGQRQRIGIARALIVQPELIVCDEPVSALDVSIQAQVINLLVNLQDEFGLTYIFISHDLSVVRHLADFVAVMYLGRVVEYGSRSQIFFDAKHPYTQALLSSTPDIGGERKKPAIIKGELPSLVNRPKGCAFASRCPMAEDQCHEQVPPLIQLDDARQVACHLV